MSGLSKILFVDDEQRILDSVRDMLRKRRTVWDMRFVRGGAEALAMLAQEPFDVVVTDLRMPGIDGFAVLEHLRSSHPGTVRLALSGDARRETALRVAPEAHRCLVKPCKQGELEAALESACSLNELIADESLRDTIGRIVELPVLPQTYAMLERLLADDRTTFATVAEVLSSDIGLSATLLRIANSALFGTGRVVSSVDHAISLLGTDLVKTVVLSEGVLGRREIPPAMRGFARRLHVHSHLVARISAEIAPTTELRKATYACAMLHDIGRLVLALEEPGAQPAGRPSLQASEPARDHHAQIGAYLLGLWGMPPSMIEAVARHHDADASCLPVTRILAAAEAIVGEHEEPSDTVLAKLLVEARDASRAFSEESKGAAS